ncbi:hypothetical protein [Haloechinothrix salitolerans]|uniref:Uncharacterized protein n=1 Tax=Haloechinothrix salitolerans TaxID=926830 RepID=A0ABW2CAB3_9PSEU
MTGPYGPNDPDEDGPSDDTEYPVDEAERAALGLPPLSSDRRERPDPPQLVRISVLLWVLSAVVMVAGFVLMLANQRAITEELLDAYETARRAGESIANREGITDSDIEAGVPGLLWLLFAGSVMIAGLIGLFAYRAREGTRSARTALALLTLVLLAFVVGMPSAFVNPLHVVALVLAAVAAVLLFLPNVSGYFPPLPRMRRRWRDFS